MPHNPHIAKRYTKRVTSDSKDVYPTVCATQYKFPQQQADKSGQYILDFFVVSRKKNPPPLQPPTKSDIIPPVGDNKDNKKGEHYGYG